MHFCWISFFNRIAFQPMLSYSSRVFSRTVLSNSLYSSSLKFASSSSFSSSSSHISRFQSSLVSGSCYNNSIHNHFTSAAVPLLPDQSTSLSKASHFINSSPSLSSFVKSSTNPLTFEPYSSTCSSSLTVDITPPSNPFSLVTLLESLSYSDSFKPR